MRKTPDGLRDRMKSYEARECDRMFLPMLPIYARLDGRSFHTFTKGMDRPYDVAFRAIMVDVTKILVEETHAIMGYTQSDEISLAWYNEDPSSEVFFNGRIFKMMSVLAGLASASFNQLALPVWPERVKKQIPVFDARVYQVPTKAELVNCFLWRELDATRNAVTMAASCYYSHKQLFQKTSKQQQEMLHAKGINFNNYPDWFKRGTYVRRESKEIPLDEAVRLKIPESKRPPKGHKVIRSSVVDVNMPPLLRVANREAVFFEKQTPCQVIGTI